MNIVFGFISDTAIHARRITRQETGIAVAIVVRVMPLPRL